MPLHSAASFNRTLFTALAAAIRRHSSEAFYQPLEAWLGGEDAAVRARVLSCLMMGATMNRMIHEDYLLDDNQRRDLCDALARTLNHFASGDD